MLILSVKFYFKIILISVAQILCCDEGLQGFPLPVGHGRPGLPAKRTLSHHLQPARTLRLSGGSSLLTKSTVFNVAAGLSGVQVGFPFFDSRTETQSH